MMHGGHLERPHLDLDQRGPELTESLRVRQWGPASLDTKHQHQSPWSVDHLDV